MMVTLKCSLRMIDENYVTLTFAFVYNLQEALFSWTGFFPSDLSSNYLKPSVFVNSYCSIPDINKESPALHFIRAGSMFIVFGKVCATAPSIMSYILYGPRFI